MNEMVSIVKFGAQEIIHGEEAVKDEDIDSIIEKSLKKTDQIAKELA